MIGKVALMGRKKKAGKKEAGVAPIEPRSWKRFTPFAAVFLLPFLIYIDTLNAGFIWDDHNLIEMNARQSSLPAIVKLWTSDFWQTGRKNSASQYYRPLTTTTFALNHRLSGPSPRAYHFTNILLYALASLAAYLVFRPTIKNSAVALLMGLLFAALPAHVENVAWVSGRTDIISAALMFASLFFYLRADRSNKPGDWIASLFLFLLSLFGKEMSITLAAMVGLHQLVFRKDIKRAALVALPFAALAGLFWIVHSLAAPGSGVENVYLTPGARAAAVLRNLGLGVLHCLVPGGEKYLVTAAREQAGRTFPAPTGIGVLLYSLPLVLALAAAAWAWLKGRKEISLAIACGLLSLLPISGIIPIGVVFAVRFLLIPSFFFILAAGLALDSIGGKKIEIAGAAVPLAALIAGPVILFYLAWSMAHTPAWRDDATLMESILAKEPDSALAHFILGNALAGKSDMEGAMTHFRRAIELRPEYPEALYNLGILEARKGRVMEAEQLYRASLKFRPEFSPPRMALIEILVKSGRRDEAMKLAEEGRRLEMEDQK
jgi:hypothetical protein